MTVELIAIKYKTGILLRVHHRVSLLIIFQQRRRAVSRVYMTRYRPTRKPPQRLRGEYNSDHTITFIMVWRYHDQQTRSVPEVIFPDQWPVPHSRPSLVGLITMA